MKPLASFGSTPSRLPSLPFIDIFSGPRGANRIARAVTIALAALALLWAVASLFWPYGWDQSCFSYVAQTILRGGQPYRDAWDFKGPLTFYVFVPLQFVFGRQMWAIRAFDLFLLSLGAASAARVVKVWAGARASLLTAGFLVISFARFGNWYTAQADGWAALLVGVSVSLLTSVERPTAKRVGVAALLIGLCTLLKPLYAAFLLLVLVTLWPGRSADGRARAVKLAAVAAAAFAAPIVLMLGWLTAKGVLSDFIDVHLRFSMERIATDPSMKMGAAKVASSMLGIVTETPLMMLTLPAAAFALVVIAGRDLRRALVLGTWPLLSLLLIVVQRKFWFQNYTWHSLYWSVGALSGIGFALLWQEAGDSARRPLGALRWFVALVLVLLFKQIALEPVRQIARFAKLATGRMSLESYRESFDYDVPALRGDSAASVGFGVARDLRIADYLRENSEPDATVLVWSDPLVNYWSGLAAITPVTLGEAFTTIGAESRRERYRAQLLTGMTSCHARWFGVPEKDLMAGAELSTHFPELIRVLSREYSYATTIGDVKLYRRNGGSCS